MRLLGWRYIPLLRMASPKLIQLDDDTCQVSIRLKRQTKNHLGSMYFGALAVGADTAAGILCFYLAEKSSGKLHFSFKAANMEFLKRADTDVVFECKDGNKICEALERAQQTKERQNQETTVLAYNSDREIVAKMIMVVSLKLQS